MLCQDEVGVGHTGGKAGLQRVQESRDSKVRSERRWKAPAEDGAREIFYSPVPRLRRPVGQVACEELRREKRTKTDPRKPFLEGARREVEAEKETEEKWPGAHGDGAAQERPPSSSARCGEMLLRTLDLLHWAAGKSVSFVWRQKHTCQI